MLKKILPHLGAVLLLVFVAFSYFAPIVFEGKSLSEHDNVQARAGQAEIHQYLKQDPSHTILWTNRLFIGMPTYVLQAGQNNGLPYAIMAQAPYQALDGLAKISHGLGGKKKTEYQGHSELSPHIALALLFLGAYLGLLLVGMPWYLALVGGLSFGLITNNMILMEAGHSTKIHAMAYLFPILGSTWFLFRKHFWLGLGLFAFFLSVQIRANHFQITYYTMLAVGFLVLAQAWRLWKQGAWQHWFKGVALLGLGTVVGLASNTTMLWTTYEYTQESIRGKSDLKAKAAESAGLDKDYIFQWSLGKWESFTLFIPHFYGGGSAHKERPAFAMDKNSQSFKELGRLAGSGQIPQQQVQQAAQLTSTYWGAQPFTAGPIYYGAVVCFLFFLGLFAVRGPEKWALGACFLFFLVLAWGKHLAWFNDLMVDYFPLYNKFRAVTMTLTAAQVPVVLLGLLGLRALTRKDSPAGLLTQMNFAQWDNPKGYVLAAAGLSAWFLALAFLFSWFSTPEGRYDAEMLKFPGYVPLVEALEQDRLSLLRGDIIRSAMFVGLAAVLAYGIALGKAYQKTMILALGLVSAADLWTLSKQYVNDKSFVSREEVLQAPAPSRAAQMVKQDKALHYRVLDLSQGDPFTNALPSFHFNSLGGYSAAKPRLYQNLAEAYLSNEQLFGANRHILQMLNVKYIIQDAQTPPVNNEPFGNAWLVGDWKVVPDADTELEAIGGGFDPLALAIVQETHAKSLEGLNKGGNPNDRIVLEQYHPERLQYKASLQTERLAIFSEIYYPPSKGWKVFIDGNPVEQGFFKVNYLLRGLRLPAGEHKIEMRFEPRSFYQGENFSLIGSILCLGFLAWGGFSYYKTKLRQDEDWV